ncbi:MAG: molybdopterin-guanine dinucleotide biosynthesis protein B [Rhodobacterales bacterium]
MRLYGVTGWKNAGKTGLMERLVAEITARGFSVSTVKHAHHSFDVDHPGKDSHRHRVAGAQEGLQASRNRLAQMTELRGEDEPPLEDLLRRLAPVDLVLIEGYKRDSHPKVEAHRAETGQPLIAPGDQTIRALASDTPLNSDRPVFDLDDTGAIADFILEEVSLKERQP